MARKRLDQLLQEARGRIARLEPAAAWAAAADGALIVDTRSDRSDGVVPGSLHVPLSVLQWRADPDSAWRNPHVARLDTQLILICEHGESSSLAAATLVDLGFSGAGDVIGGIEAWKAAGLPLVPAPPPPPGLPGMAGPQKAPF